MEPPRKIMKSSSSTRYWQSLAQLPSPDEVINEKDLPLLANIDDVLVRHYLMKLSTNFTKKVITGNVILFLDWLKPKEKRICLDQCFLKVHRVVALKRLKEYDVGKSLSAFEDSCGGVKGSRKHFYRSNQDIDWFDDECIAEDQQLQFTQNKWSVSIRGWSGEDGPPSVVRIDYETLETSPSVHWRPCDGFNYEEATKKCCYSPAPQLNNRGLFPCQEPPSAVATWEILLECEKEYTPLVTSDEIGEVIGAGKEGSMIHYFYCTTPLPMSTFVMIIGQFSLQKSMLPPPEFTGDKESV